MVVDMGNLGLWFEDDDVAVLDGFSVLCGEQGDRGRVGDGCEGGEECEEGEGEEEREQQQPLGWGAPAQQSECGRGCQLCYGAAAL